MIRSQTYLLQCLCLFGTQVSNSPAHDSERRMAADGEVVSGTASVWCSARRQLPGHEQTRDRGGGEVNTTGGRTEGRTDGASLGAPGRPNQQGARLREAPPTRPPVDTRHRCRYLFILFNHAYVFLTIITIVLKVDYGSSCCHCSQFGVFSLAYSALD